MQVETRSESSREDERSLLPVSIGDVLDGKYRVVRVLGKGGMGVIVAAVHLGLGHRVALKFLLQSAVQSEEVVARFAREARAAAMIKSEHATRVLDVGQLQNGVPYMVLELLEGSDLGAHLSRNGPLPVEDAVTYVLEACEAIAEAHSLGIVHRDLKPDNLFLARRPDGTRSVKVLDFGISKLPLETEPPSERGSPLTTTSAVIGSPMYMSPEQLRATRDADPRSDIWSIGVTLYELVSGEGPFPWKSLPELCAAILKEPPTPLRTRVPRAPVELDAVLARCLQKNPADRYANVAELAAALSPFGRPSAIASSERAMRLLSRASRANTRPEVISATSTREPPPTEADPGRARTQESPMPSVTESATLASQVALPNPKRRLSTAPIALIVAALILAAGGAIRQKRTTAPGDVLTEARSGLSAALDAVVAKRASAPAPGPTEPPKSTPPAEEKPREGHRKSEKPRKQSPRVARVKPTAVPLEQPAPAPTRAPRTNPFEDRE